VRAATHGRPWEVLEFIDRCENPRRPLPLDIASKASCAAALPHARIALRAAEARYDYMARQVSAMQKITDGFRELENG
jgi:hypothetical protein